MSIRRRGVVSVKEEIYKLVSEMPEDKASEVLAYIREDEIPNKETREALLEAERLCKEGKGVHSIAELRKALESDGSKVH